MSCGPSAGASTTCRTWSPFPRDANEVRAAARVVRRAWGGRHPVRRRHQRRRRRRGEGGRRVRGCGDARPRSARPRARDRPDLARRVDPGRRHRAVPRGPAARARSHAAPLSPVVSALDARWLDRDARGRSLRDSLHAHRRHGRIDLRRDAGRRHRDTPAAGIGCGTESGPHAARIGGHPRSDHRGLGARAGSSRAQGVGGGDLSGLRRRRRGGAGARAERPVPDELPAARSTRGADHRCVVGRRAARPRVRVGRPSGGRVDGACARAGRRPRGNGEQAQRRQGLGRRVAGHVRARAIPARHVRRLRGDQRHVRDRDHVGPLRRSSTPR